MYNPRPFRTDDLNSITEFLKEFSFGTIFAHSVDKMFTVSVPMLANPELTKLSGHLAAANPIWKHVDGKEVSIVFQGPNHYISPLWYSTPYEVPTWNYILVAAEGKIKILTEESEKIRIVDELSDYHEKRYGQSWKVDWNNNMYNSKLKAIVAFEISITSIEMKRKLSQNHPKESTKNVSQELLKLNDRDSSVIGQLMGDL